MSSATTAPKPFGDPIFFGKKIIDGVPFAPDSRVVLETAIAERRPVEVATDADYVNLYHVFDRRVKAGELKLKMVKRRVGDGRWHVFFVKSKKELPKIELEDGFDPARGRYKRYADGLTSGEIITFSDRDEAVKARRAWQFYVKKEDRAHLRCVIRGVKRFNKFTVVVIERAG